MTKMKHFSLNGQMYKANDSLTLSDLIAYFNYNHNLLVLEYNDLICNRTDWNKIFIQSKDKIEIITIVGGG